MARKIFSAMLLAACGLAATGTEALAAIEMKMVVQRDVVTTDAKGNSVHKLVEPKLVVPGDEVVYTTEYHNNSKEAADGVAITNPIPREITYVDGSAEGEGRIVTYSVDGGKNFDVPGKLSVTGADGKKRPAVAKDYTHIRWLIKTLPPQARGQVSFHAKVN